MSQNEGTANRPVHQIYIIDDEPDIMLIVTELLSPRQYEVTAFNSAPELLEAIRTRPPLAVITDFKMSEITGIEVVRAIREFDQKVRLAILMGFADKDLAIESLNSGVNDLIEKPITAKKLLDIVEKYRDHREAEEKNEQNEIAEIRGIFLEEARDLYAEIDNEILKLEDVPLDRNVVDSLFRRVHSVKGGSGSVPGAQRLSKMSHEFENALSMIRKGQITPHGGMIDVFLTAADCSRQLFNFIESQTQPDEALEAEIQQIESALQALQRNDEPAAETNSPSDKAKSSATKGESAQDKDDGILVPNERLDDFMRLSGELIVLKNTFDQVASHDDSFHDITQLRRRLGDLMVNLNKMTDELQSLIVSVRKIPLEKALSKVPRLVRQTARTTGKKVALETTGLEMGVDKNLSKALSQCLTHMVRNSVDHGIEAPEERVRSGKSDTGTITIAANESQGVIRVTVTDDGKGINRDKVLRKAVSAGLIEDSQAQSLKDDEIFALLFEPGFSTADQVTDVSGRGVGMDAVKTAVEMHGGKILVSSEPGKGSQFILEIPVPRAVMIEKTVLATLGQRHFAIPLDGINRIVSCKDLQFFEVDGRRRCMLDGNAVITGEYQELLSMTFDRENKELENQSCVFLRAKNRTIGLLVDRIDGQLEAVVKPFDPLTGDLPGLKGTSMFGSDRVAYIVSPESFLNLALESTAA